MAELAGRELQPRERVESDGVGGPERLDVTDHPLADLEAGQQGPSPRTQRAEVTGQDGAAEVDGAAVPAGDLEPRSPRLRLVVHVRRRSLPALTRVDR